MFGYQRSYVLSHGIQDSSCKSMFAVLGDFTSGQHKARDAIITAAMNLTYWAQELSAFYRPLRNDEHRLKHTRNLSSASTSDDHEQDLCRAGT